MVSWFDSLLLFTRSQRLLSWDAAALLLITELKHGCFCILVLCFCQALHFQTAARSLPCLFVTARALGRGRQD